MLDTSTQALSDILHNFDTHGLAMPIKHLHKASSVMCLQILVRLLQFAI
jgi:hypothetical protein